MGTKANLLSYIFAHPVLLAIIVIVAVAALVIWLISPPNWRDYEDTDSPAKDVLSRFSGWWNNLW